MTALGLAGGSEPNGCGIALWRTRRELYSLLLRGCTAGMRKGSRKASLCPPAWSPCYTLLLRVSVSYWPYFALRFRNSWPFFLVFLSSMGFSSISCLSCWSRVEVRKNSLVRSKTSEPNWVLWSRHGGRRWISKVIQRPGLSDSFRLLLQSPGSRTPVPGTGYGIWSSASRSPE